MTRLASAGTSSCAVMSIAHFKNGIGCLGPQKNIDWNEEYKKTRKKVKVEKGVDWFRDSILGPTTQPLGATDEMPFEQLMEDIDGPSNDLSDKTIFVTLNDNQFYGNGEYWPGELERWGFKYMFKSNNSWGEMNHVFVRNFIPLD